MKEKNGKPISRPWARISQVPAAVPVQSYSELVEMLAADGDRIRFGHDFSKEQEAKICQL